MESPSGCRLSDVRHRLLWPQSAGKVGPVEQVCGTVRLLAYLVAHLRMADCKPTGLPPELLPRIHRTDRATTCFR